MARRWRNYTDLSDDWCRQIYDAVCPPGLKAHDVEIKNNQYGGGRGRAYSQGSGYHATARPFIVVSIPTTERTARVVRHANNENGYLPVVIGSRAESFVYILAHELRHLWQAKAKGRPRGMVYGSRGRFSERDACAYGLQMLRRFRRGELE